MTTHADLFTEIKRRLWNLVGAVEITGPEAEELCRLIRTRARLKGEDKSLSVEAFPAAGKEQAGY